METDELTRQLGNHYAPVRKVMLEKLEEFSLPDAFVERMGDGLELLVNGATTRQLSWGSCIIASWAEQAARCSERNRRRSICFDSEDAAASLAF